MNTHTVWLALMSSATLAAANNLPDAGSVSRDAETAAPAAPAAPPPVIRESADKAASDAADSTPFEVRDIRISGVSLLPENEIRTLTAPYLGHSHTLSDLQGLANQITARYHAAGYPLAVALIPPQRIENGVVRVRVIEGGVDAVRLENASRLSDYTVRAYLAPNIRNGGTFRQPDAESRLLRLRQLAGVKGVDYLLSAAPASEKTNITVALDKAPLFSGSVGMDNYGSRSTGRIRSHLAMQANSPLGRGERFAFKAMSSFKGVNNARLSADVPIGTQGTVLSVGAGHTRYELGGAFKNLDASGKADSIDVLVRHPVVLRRSRNLWLTAGGERRKLRDEIGVTHTVTRKKVQSVHAGVNGGFQDQMLLGGYTALGVNAAVGKLNILDDDARALDAVAAKTQGKFRKVSANVGHTRLITPKLSISGSLQAQWANKNLDSGEQMSVGGAEGVAGYRSNDVSVDTGVVGQTELRYAVNSHLSVNGFLDAARVRQQQKPYAVGKNTLALYGGGIGAELRVKDFSLQSKLAWRGSDDGADGRKRALWWVKAEYAF